ncbi:hypothetical protein B0A49_02946 [Cryomyces minteri]|uniref:Uncharacterized protein n=1 Tax=Cryomyces minteri TaxID=331657 RepID=A0A4V5NJ81_9PEZI|nr:hypothetical protein B0A49_02946 [Cryomyces minteri]
MPRAQAGIDYRPRRQQAYPGYPLRYYGRHQGFHNYYYPRHYDQDPRLGRGPEGPWPACGNWDEADEDDDSEDQEDEIYEQAMFDLRARGYSQEQAVEILRRQRPQIGGAGAAPAADPQYDDAPPEHAENDGPLRRAPSPPPPPPALSQEDPRLPSRGVQWTDPVILYTADAFATHLMTVTLNNPHPPAVTLAAEIHDIAVQKQAERDPETEPADVVQQAMTTKDLEHVSDGPRGGTWVIKATREDVLAALWELPKSTWMLLGDTVVFGRAFGEGEQGTAKLALDATDNASAKQAMKAHPFEENRMLATEELLCLLSSCPGISNQVFEIAGVGCDSLSLLSTLSLHKQAQRR